MQVLDYYLVTRPFMVTSGSPNVGFRSTIRSTVISEGLKAPSGGETALHFCTLCSYCFSANRSKMTLR